MALQKNIWLRLLLAIAVALLLQWSFAKLAAGFAGLALNVSGEAVDLKDHILLLGGASSLALLFTAFLFAIVADKIPLATMGFAWNGNEKYAFSGLAVAVFILSISSFIFSVAGYVSFAATDAAPANIVSAFLVMGLVAIGEEVFFRGYLQRNIAKLVNPKLAWLLNHLSLLKFIFLHLPIPFAFYRIYEHHSRNPMI